VSTAPGLAMTQLGDDDSDDSRRGFGVASRCGSGRGIAQAPLQPINGEGGESLAGRFLSFLHHPHLPLNISPDIRVSPSPVPIGARALSTLTGQVNLARPLIKLEVISESETACIRIVESVVVFYNILYLTIVTWFARYRWAVDPNCLPKDCDRSDFRAIVWFNFIVVAIFTFAAFIFFIYFVYLVVFVVDETKTRHRHSRHPVVWACLLLMPTVVLCNNPVINGDRIQVLWRYGGGPSSTLSLMRYAVVAYSISAVTLYLILKFGSLERENKNMYETFTCTFYVTRVVPLALVFVSFCVTGITRRVELSPQPLVSLVTLARNGKFGVLYPAETIAAVVPVSVFQVAFLVFFVTRYFIISRRLAATSSYVDARLKFISVYFLYRHTIVPLLVTMCATCAAAALFPTTLTMVRSSTSRFTNTYVLDVPFFARSGIVSVYCTWGIVESYVHLPAVYNPTWLERALIERFGMHAGSAFAPRAKTSRGVIGGDDCSDSSASGAPCTAPENIHSPSTVVDVHALPQIETNLEQADETPTVASMASVLNQHPSAEGRGTASDCTDVSPPPPIIWEAPRNEYGQISLDNTLTSQLRFDETVLMYNFSWLAYLSDEVIKSVLSDNADGAFSLRQVWRESVHDLVVATIISKDMLVVAFRGSVSMANMRLNIQTSQARHLPRHDPLWLSGRWKAPTWGSKTPAVHRGFEAAYAMLRKDTLSDIQDVLSLNPNIRVLLCGHSLGGALATLCAFDCRVTLCVPASRCSLYTFGSPRVGNPSFARRFAAASIDSWRICNHSDFITNNPVRFLHNYKVFRCLFYTLSILIVVQLCSVPKPNNVLYFNVHASDRSI
jgi:Lipase (class 3)